VLKTFFCEEKLSKKFKNHQENFSKSRDLE
jgi:hypothetical protein